MRGQKIYVDGYHLVIVMPIITAGFSRSHDILYQHQFGLNRRLQ